MRTLPLCLLTIGMATPPAIASADRIVIFVDERFVVRARKRQVGPLQTVLRMSRRVLILTLLSVSSTASADPISSYYLTAGDQGMNWVVQGASITNSWNQAHPEFGGEYAIAVDSTVRTLGSGNQGAFPPSHVGSQYTLGGV